jgi:hypothetical protein
MRCLAVIIEDSDIANTIMSQLTQAYKHAGVDFAFFTDIESAITWLKEHEITLDHPDVSHFFQQNLFYKPHHN